MAVNNGITFSMAYTPRDNVFEGGRRLARVLMVWWSLAVLALFIVSAVIEFWYLDVSIKIALWLLVFGVAGIWFASACIGYVVRGFMGIRG